MITMNSTSTMATAAANNNEKDEQEPAPPLDPKEWEQRSTQVLSAIRCFVDGLRSAPCLSSCTTTTTLATIKGTAATTTANSNGETSASGISADRGSLWMHLQSLGLLQKVQELHRLHVHDDGGASKSPDESSQTVRIGSHTSSVGSLLQNHYEGDERKQILNRIIFPLLMNLEQCYEFLDNLPQISSSSSSSSASRDELLSNITKPRNKQKNKAPPPLGMLSLIDYTNVACLLEFAISVSLVPFLEYPGIYLPSFPTTKQTNTTNQDGCTTTEMMPLYKNNKHTTSFMAQRRSQSLSKSLAGRISKAALTWGTMYAAESHDSLCNKLLAFNSQHLNDDNRSPGHPKDANEIHQIYHIYNTYQAYNEMTILANTTGHLLLLDRFRPMLLPRHLNDVYLTLLIAERLRWCLSRFDKQVQPEVVDASLSTMVKHEKEAEMKNSQKLHSLHKALLLSPLAFHSSFISASATPLPPQSKVDCREAALAYRNLLGGGASMIDTAGPSNAAIPPWLRLRLGQCLTKLAQQDLQSVVEVFVAYACGPGGDQNKSDEISDDIMTSAAARLARALCAKPSSSSKQGFNAFQKQLCGQFVDFLVVQGERIMKDVKENTGNSLTGSRLSMAMSLTLWAAISQLSMESLHSFFITKLISGLIPRDSADPKNKRSNHLTTFESTSAIAAWLFSMPSSLDPSTNKKIKSFLLESCNPDKALGGHNDFTIFGQTSRLAALISLNTKTAESSLVVEIDNQGDEGNKVFARLVEMALAQMIHVLSRIDSFDRRSGQELATTAMKLFKAMSANSFDKEGYCFVFSESEHECHDPKDVSNLCFRKVHRRSDSAASVSLDLSYLIEGIEQRAKSLVGAIVSLEEIKGDSPGVEKNDSASNLDHWLPSTLFRQVLLVHFSTISTDGDLGKRKQSSPKLESGIDLWGSEDISKSNRHELKVAATVLLAVLCENCPPSLLLGNSQGNNNADAGVLEVLGLIIDAAAARIETAPTMNADDGDSEELFSTTSIVLSLLIALLELGAQKRSESDESFFESILPSLCELSSDSLESMHNYTIPPELAEMASHAMALIVARGESAKIKDDVPKPAATSKKSWLEAIVEKLSQAERDLQSSQPPLRAKGVVSLRHIARSLINEEDTGSGRDPSIETKGMITEMNEPPTVSSDTPPTKEEIALVSRTLARICLDALADSESYVYLASIQTLVAISDICPSEILPVMGLVIAKGKLGINVAMSDSEVTTVETSLTPEQRIKAAEALIFMIRRRGDAIFMCGPSLLDVMLFGPKENSGEAPILFEKEIAPQLIQSQTHTYFIGEINGESEENEHDEDDEKKIRLNTGGPVFSMEENDVLRAGAISVVCELVSVLNPTAVARVAVGALVGLATDALQLEASRPVRRAAASLARELYACTVREATAENESDTDYTSSMAIAMVEASEERLCNALSSCVSANEIDVDGKIRPVDPATQARSAEALDIRLELEGLGILQGATMIARSLKQELKDPKVQAVRRALSQSAV